MDKTRLLKIIEKYNHGSCSEMERKLLDDFCEKLQLQPYDLNLTPVEQRLVKASIFNKIQHQIHTDSKKQSPSIIRQLTTTRMKWVAALLILIGLAALLPLLLNPHSQMITEATGYGEERIIKLNDGSKVYLGALSTLSYPKSFGDNREVDLQGEAFFEVTRNEEKPFIVSSDDLLTKVLGTSFNIKAYRTDDQIEIALATGKVLVGKACDVSEDLSRVPKSSVLLHPNMMAVFLKGSDSLFTQPTDLKEINAKRKGMLYFDNEMLSEVTKTLSRYYEVDINFDTAALKNIKINGQMKTDTLKNLLENLEFLTGLQFRETKKGTILIQKKTRI